MHKRLLSIILGLLIPAIVGVIQIYQWITPEKAKVVVFTDASTSYEDVAQPTRAFIDVCSKFGQLLADPNTPEKYAADFNKAIDAFKLQATVLPANRVDKQAVRLVQEAMRIFTEHPNQLPYTYYYVIPHFRVCNIGSAQAQDVILRLQSPGFYELWASGSSSVPEQSGRTEGDIHIPHLNAEETKWLIYWPVSWRDDIPPLSASFSGGKTEIMAGSVQRDGHNIVFQFGKVTFLAAIAGLIIFGIIIIAVWTSKRSTRKA